MECSCANCQWWDDDYYWNNWKLHDRGKKKVKTWFGLRSKKVYLPLEERYELCAPEDKQGYCTRHAPQQIRLPGCIPDKPYPVTHNKHLCGDWESK